MNPVSLGLRPMSYALIFLCAICVICGCNSTGQTLLNAQSQQGLLNAQTHLANYHAQAVEDLQARQKEFLAKAKADAVAGATTRPADAAFMGDLIDLVSGGVLFYQAEISAENANYATAKTNLAQVAGNVALAQQINGSGLGAPGSGTDQSAINAQIVQVLGLFKTWLQTQQK
jgi:hypothetical protein